MKVYAFPRGGLVVDDPTVPPKGSSAVAFLPVLSVIPLGGYAGPRVYPLVNVGDTVREGMLIGRASGHGAVNVHATVPGRVIRRVTWNDAEGISTEALVIRMEGAFDRLGRREDVFPWSGISSYDLQRLIAEYGVVEMEGSGRPVADMISAFGNVREPGSLVVRCVFDDPWLAADYALCEERLAAVVEGSFIAAHAAGKVGRVVFAVSHREKAQGEAMLAEAGNWDLPASLVLVGSRYPQRNRRELEMALRVYEKKENVGLGSLLMLGPATLAAIHDAVKYKRPILDRYVAVGGSAVKNPRVMKARVGKRIGELFDECGGFIDSPRRIARGTPFSGKIVADLDEPITKTSYAVFALLKNHAGDHPERDCIGCGECRSVCPIGLDPEELYKRIVALEAGRPLGENAQVKGPASTRNPEGFGGIAAKCPPIVEAADCHGCGCCEVVCPSHLPLSGVILGNPRRNQRA
jgi:electron transport complex protein RnfC